MVVASLVSAYLTGFVVFGWTLWFFDELDDLKRLVEVFIWPLSMIVGTYRRLRRWR